MDRLHIGPIHLLQELSRIGGEGFDVASLPFGKERIKGQGRFARPGNTGDHRHLSPGDVTGDILEIMGFRPNNFDELVFHTKIITYENRSLKL